MFYKWVFWQIDEVGWLNRWSRATVDLYILGYERLDDKYLYELWTEGSWEGI